MRDLNIEMAKSQLEMAKVSVDVGTSVMKLLEFWKTLPHLASNDAQIVDVFSKLAVGIALIDNQGNEIWEPGMPGFIRVGDEVRVLANAFEGELGQLHNGRRGRVVAVRSGDIIVKTTDGREPALDGSHYSPYKVEKLVATL
jgi:hypothetical protein